MHKDKHYRKFRHFHNSPGPSNIQKEILPFDSCEIFPYRREYWSQAKSKWAERLDKHDLSGLCREDPFGINNYHLRFSLNKKKRWIIPEEIGERIEDIQDPRLSLRVSSFVRDIDISQWRLNRFVDAMEYLGCVDYHSVSRDGERVIHRQSSKYRTRVRIFSHPDSQPERKVKGHPRRPRYRERWDSAGCDLPYDEQLKCQLLHVSYTITLFSHRPSLHNKASQKSPVGFARKLSKKYRSNPIEAEEEDYFVNENEEEDYFVNENEEEDVIDDRFPSTTVDLSSFVVKREKRQRKAVRSVVIPMEEEADGFVIVTN